MHTIKHLSDEQLRQTVKQLVAHDRQQLLDLVDHLGEVETRGLYLRWGYASMWDYSERELKLKDGVAHLRLTLARLLRKKPDLRPILLSGELGVCTACELWRHVEAPEFADLLEKAKGMSKREFKDSLASRNLAGTPKREMIRRIGGDAPKVAPKSNVASETDKFPLLSAQPMLAFPDTDVPTATKPVLPAPAPKIHRITFNASEQDVAVLKKLQDLLGTSEVGEVLSKAMEALLDQKDPQRRDDRRKKRQAAKPGRGERRRLNAADYDKVLLADDQRCAYRGPDGVRCTQRRHLEVDHVVAYALGGATTVENSRVLCAAHNKMLARDIFGNRVPTKAASTARPDASHLAAGI